MWEGFCWAFSLIKTCQHHPIWAFLFVACLIFFWSRGSHTSACILYCSDLSRTWLLKDDPHTASNLYFKEKPLRSFWARWSLRCISLDQSGFVSDIISPEGWRPQPSQVLYTQDKGRMVLMWTTARVKLPSLRTSEKETWEILIDARVF